MSEIPIRSKARKDMIEACGRLCQLLGLPRSMGQIYGLLYLSPEPLSLDDVVRLLGISKGSASMGTRQLLAWGAVRQVWVPRDRKDYFEAIADLGALLRGGYDNFVKPKLTSTGQRLTRMEELLEADRASGALNAAEHRLCQERIQNMTRMQKRMQQLAPLAEKLL